MANLTTPHPAAAAASSSASASSSGSHYDVFINHRGPDIKRTFASHLYRALLQRGLSVFLDKDELEEGHNISSQIEHAIRAASVHVAIFSPTYAESSWCLDELVLMKNSGATILPVFFKVDPSTVRHTVQNGPYAEALLNLERKSTHDPETGVDNPRYSFDTIQNWRDALYSVANLSGFVHGDEDDEGELLFEVVEGVLKKIPKTPLDVAKYATGLGKKLQDFEKTVLWQNQEEENRVEAKVVGIVGVGGVGKTTLAKEFFNLRRSDYNSSSFLFEVRENARKTSLSYLQSKLLEDLKHKNIKIDSRDEGIGILKKHLSSSDRVIIVLDDVDHVDQLEAVLPIKKILNPDSLLLVTSRDKHALISSGVSEQSIYYLKGLDTPDSQKLFCCYAFHQPDPIPKFADLVDRFVTACDGLPLSLKVFGAQVCGENERSAWQEILDELDKILPTTEIFDRLKISFDSLSPKTKEIFLDIACFFLREDADKAMRIWGKVGVRNLLNRCLVEVDSGNFIKMHDHVRDMGRKIAEEGTIPRRLWHWTTSIIDDLSSPAITEIRGITMVASAHDAFRDIDSGNELSEIRSSDVSWIKSLEMRHLFHNFHFPGMMKLQLVATEEDHLEDILRRVHQPHLIWLRWYRCSHFSLPDWIPMKNFRVLEVEGRRLNTLWPHQCQGTPLDLRELNIRAPLSEIPKSIGQLKYLERIRIWHPAGSPEPLTLKRLPDEFCHLLSLKYLVFNGFSGMVSLPEAFGELINLQHISLKGASSLVLLPDSFGELINLQHITLKGASSLQMLPNSFGNLNQLKHISLQGASSLHALPNSFGNLNQLKHISLKGASSLHALPNSFGNLTRLEHLTLSGCEILTISNITLGNITTLEFLNLSHCKHVKELPPQVAHQLSLQKLYLEGTNLKELPLGLGDLKTLKILSLSFSPQLKSLPDSVALLTQLTDLHIKNCGIEYLPQELLKMSNLTSLEVWNCPLREHPFKREFKGERETLLTLEGERALNNMNSSIDMSMFGLKDLELRDTEIREVFFDNGACPNLECLSLNGCHELRQIGGLCGLPKLRDLAIQSCAKLEELFGLETLICLENLNIWRCEKLLSIPGLGQLAKLQALRVNNCSEIQHLRGVEYLTSLEQLDVRECEKLHSIQGLEQLSKLRTLFFLRSPDMQELSGVEHLTSLEILYVKGCQSIQGLEQLRNLRYLYVNGCPEIPELSLKGCEKLQSIQGLGQLTKLIKLEVFECGEIQDLLSVEHLISLERLNVERCKKLQSIPGLGQVTKLRILNLTECCQIQALPCVENLAVLEELNVTGCQKLQSIQGLRKLTKLRELNVRECYEIRELPGVEHLTLLEILDARGCPKLKWCEGVLDQLRQQLKEGLKCDKQRERCSCLQFLQSLCHVFNIDYN